MAFAESIKADLRRRADMCCCVCHAVGIEIHHIVPEAEGGDDCEANAAPLCPACHETYGANPTKRKFLREAKDNWLAACARRVNGPCWTELLRIAAEGRVTKDDLSNFKQELLSEFREVLRPYPGRRPQTLGEILRFFYEFKPNPSRVTLRDVEFVHLFVWGGKSNDEDVEKVKGEFSATFGTAMVKALIRYVLHHHPTPTLADGFTDEDMGWVVRRLFVDMIMLLHHSDLHPKDQPLELAITPNGLLRARCVELVATPEWRPAGRLNNSGVGGGPPSVT